MWSEEDMEAVVISSYNDVTNHYEINLMGQPSFQSNDGTSAKAALVPQ